MYPMRSHIWSFFQRIGAAAQAATRQSKKKRSEQMSFSPTTSIFSQLFFLSRSNDKNVRSKSPYNPDSMIFRYTFLTATCLTMAFLLIKIIRKN